MKPRAARCAVVALLAFPALRPLVTQAKPTISLVPGWGVDTSHSPEREIFRLWHGYLADRPDSIHPSAYWSAVEQAEFPEYDLLRGYVHQGYPAWTVVHLAPSPRMDSTYLIRTLVARAYDSASVVKPLALFRVYAVREQGRWVLANALPRLTKDWKRATIGPVTFVYPGSHRFDRSRAEGSARFVDSIAAAFDVPAPRGIRYYVAANLDEMFWMMGLDFFPSGSDTAGGRSNAIDRLVFSGSASVGEAYRHELAHLVFAPLLRGRTFWLVSEGLATWAGGSAGLGFQQLLPGLARYLQLHPEVTLDGVAADPPARAGTLDVGYDGFAVLCEMVYEKGGASAVKALADAGTSADAVLDSAARLLGLPRRELSAAWRRKVLAGVQ